jgi:hypothetical protein
VERRKIVSDFRIYLVLMHDDAAAETKLLYGFVLLIFGVKPEEKKTKIVQADDESFGI